MPCLNAMQPAVAGPSITLERLEVWSPQAHLYSYTNADAMGSMSNLVESVLSLSSYDVYAPFDSGATNSFILK